MQRCGRFLVYLINTTNIPQIRLFFKWVIFRAQKFPLRCDHKRWMEDILYAARKGTRVKRKSQWRHTHFLVISLERYNLGRNRRRRPRAQTHKRRRRDRRRSISQQHTMFALAATAFGGKLFLAVIDARCVGLKIYAKRWKRDLRRHGDDGTVCAALVYLRLGTQWIVVENCWCHHIDADL